MTLFDDPPVLGHPTARATDPATSAAAAASMVDHVSGQCRQVLEAVAWSPATAYDVVVHLQSRRRSIQQSVAARRLTDLARAGFVADTGDTRPGSTGRPLTVWRATDAGRAYLQRVTP